MKKNQHIFTLLSGLFAVGLMTTEPILAADASYHLLKEIPIRDGGKWTAMAVDETGRRLYAAHGSRVEVINLNNETPAGAITDTPDVRGLAIAPSFHMGFASSGKAQAVSLVDLNTLRTTTKMKTGVEPAAVVFEPSKLQLYAFNQGDHSATAGEADDGDFLATIDLGGKPSSAATDSKATYDSKNGRVFSSIEDKNEVVAIDVGTHKLTDHWPVAPGQSPRSLAYDAANHRLLVACANKLLVLLDSTNGKVLATVPIGDGAGEVVYDSASQNVFSSATDGTVTIIHEDAPDKITVLQTLKTKPGANVLGLDGKTHKIYVGSADFAGTGNASNPIPGTSKILIYGM
jgi:DNA-binding beta-propeller fold protein YncE